MITAKHFRVGETLIWNGPSGSILTNSKRYFIVEVRTDRILLTQNTKGEYAICITSDLDVVNRYWKLPSSNHRRVMDIL